MEKTLNNNPSFWIKNIPIYGDLILAPMDGISDLPFRTITRRIGSAASYTEFVNCIDVVQNQPGIASKVAFREEERPVVIQVFDEDPDRMVEAGLKLMEFKPDVLDVNMGCPSKDVAGRGAGAGLLRQPQKIAEIFKKLTRVIPVPVTGKIRLGWDESSKNYLEVVKMIEDNGGSLVAVHARTKSQSYGGQADWESIAEIKQNVRIPVIGNGDVHTIADIELMKSLTGCDGVMIGRAAIENPWIFARRDRDTVPIKEVQETLIFHLNEMLNFYGPRGLIIFRKYIKGYLRPYKVNPALLRSVLTCDDLSMANAGLEDIFATIQP
jgi:tRNA-dihydrouridine synthase B